MIGASAAALDPPICLAVAAFDPPTWPSADGVEIDGADAATAPQFSRCPWCPTQPIVPSVTAKIKKHEGMLAY
jgi:hypothetical protein